MKKLLLSLAAIAAFSVASASEVTLNVNDVTDMVGEDIAEVPAEGNKNGQARHVQPLESFNLGDYAFSFTKPEKGTAPAYYWNMSTSSNTQNTVRVYVNNTMTIKSATPFGKIVFTGSNGKKADVHSASVGTVAMESASKMVWGAETAVTEVTITMAGTFRFSELTISTEGGDAPEPVETKVFTKASSIVSGSQYIVLVGNQIGGAIASDASFGRLSLSKATFSGEDVTTIADNALTITETVDGYTILDAFNRYFGMDDSHLTTFQLYTDLNSGCYWDIEFQADGTAKITNKLNPSCVVCKSGTYTNVAPAKDPTDFTLPTLYVAKNSAIEAVEAADADAPVEFFNLQGVRVANPEGGIFIRRQGSSVSKVIVK